MCGAALSRSPGLADSDTVRTGTYDNYFTDTPPKATVCDSRRTTRLLVAGVGAAGVLLFGGAAIATGARRRPPPAD
ncbi:hypothetical protein GCM10027445_19580 [Amycolatopsis endophytica]|uniref:Uncharacterized protein n=1 Tax=Amycolatopsis endophytica TaxID=860233 RepID=A0A853BDQ9_9PSEU|nr:hypothetical protein [Amycolatopsis endophytica]NYI93150.1 hypothetical protein [Amycolatopsis endophytica]